ncbi:hyaluronidase-1-like isoform X2 [Erythrolamprus reginae]|uniref:hyaluronidase-1-like isoform X2 n=1 Tax=Erythrolamprus reginae TaxID=121349 RepID=UPI00396CE24D
MAAKLFRIAHHSRTSCSAWVLKWASTQLRLYHSLGHQIFLLLLLLFPDGPAALPLPPLPPPSLKPALPPIVKNKPFLVFWNAPTARCASAYNVSLHLDSYGILVNSQEAFVGGNITIFYYDQLGLYPYYMNTTGPHTAVHGGCPQNVSLKDHLEKMKKDIAATMPSRSFAGLAVIDWENWRPQWIRNWDKKNIYREMSLLLVKQRNPHFSDSEAELEAKWEFETAAQKFMTDTLRLAQSLRPDGWWGYYLFPDCYNYDYLDDFEGFTGHCPPVEVQRNNDLSWLWEHSRALYPSIYLEEILRTSAQGKKFVRAKVDEALRVAELPSVQHSLPVFVYARPFYTYTLKELSQTDLVYTIGQAAAMGAHGIVLWGDSEFSRNRSNCLKVHKYLKNTLGPYIVNVTRAAELCSRHICNNHGRCVRRRMDSDTYLHLGPKPKEGISILELANRTLSQQQKVKMEKEFACHCYKGWDGKRCIFKGHSVRLWADSWCIYSTVLSLLWIRYL